ncbi:heavy-metal-associated domain-containing protein [Lentilactobacillus kisonensis]|nr:heavy-metal-associated domain-containing protein [Lentilactobacillus kisonensis]
MSKAILQLDALSCPACMQKIQGALEKQTGVENVKVLFNAAKVKTEFNGEQISADKLSDTITDLGYEVQSMKVKE